MGVIDDARDALQRGIRRVKRVRNRYQHERRVARKKREERNNAKRRQREISRTIKRKAENNADHIERTGEDNPRLVKEIEELREAHNKLGHRRRVMDRLYDKHGRKAEKLYRRLRWAIGKRTWLRKKLKRVKEQAQQTGEVRWEDWMANGADARVVPAVKAWAAWGVVKYDLYVTSLRRNFIPPGGSSTSHHLTGHAGDVAGSRMQEFQIASFNKFRGVGSCWELYGPSNVHNLRYGGQVVQGEGTPNEQLHDSHDHGAFA